MNKVIKKLKNGDFEVVSTSYGFPVAYNKHKLLSDASSRKHSVRRDKGH